MHKQQAEKEVARSMQSLSKLSRRRAWTRLKQINKKLKKKRIWINLDCIKCLKKPKLKLGILF